MHAFDALIARQRMSPAQPAEAESRSPTWLPEKDRPVLAAAIRLGCDALVTGDRTHFGATYCKVFGGVKIESPRSLAERLFSQDR